MGSYQRVSVVFVLAVKQSTWCSLQDNCKRNAKSSIKIFTAHLLIEQRHSILSAVKDCGRSWLSSDILDNSSPLSASFMMARVLDNGEASLDFPVSNGAKQGCVLAPTLFSMMFLAMLTDAFNQDDQGVSMRYRTDGKLFNQRCLNAMTKVKTTVMCDQLQYLLMTAP